MSYFISEEKGKLCIRKYVVKEDGTRSYPRYPAKAYSHITSREELEQFVNRLNHREDETKKRNIEIRTSFIPATEMDAFRSHLRTRIPTEKDFNYIYNTVLQDYFLGFFIGVLKIYDPNQWPKYQDAWAESLLGTSEKSNLFDYAPSVKTIKTTIQTANRFVEFMHRRLPESFSLFKFDPIGAARLKDYDARIRHGDEPLGKYIPDDDWQVIEGALPIDIAPFVKLGYYYGLRRGETLGFNDMDVRNAFLRVERQLVAGSKYAPLKGRYARKTPHWFMSPAQCLELIRLGLNHRMHPDTLGARFVKLMKELGFKYEMHDLRRTFITKALRLQNPVDVQHAVGHKNLATTMRYQRDDRNLDDEVFKGEAS